MAIQFNRNLLSSILELFATMIVFYQSLYGFMAQSNEVAINKNRIYSIK